MRTFPSGEVANSGHDIDYVKNRFPQFYAFVQEKKQTSSPPPRQRQQLDLFLPRWPDAARGVPNAVLRSALFSVIKKGARAYVERREIHAQEGIHIVFTGARLDQLDLDVWITVLHVARLQKLGDECRASAYQLLKILDKTDSGSNRNTLSRCLSRMKATAVDVKVGRYSYEGSLIDEVYRCAKNRGYVIRLNPKLISLFAADQFTQADWSVRNSLRNKPLAQWLHGYYSSHAKPHPVRLSTLLKMSDSANVHAGSAKQTVVKALAALKEASEANSLIFEFQIAGDLVHVQRTRSGSQDRHLAKKVRSMTTVTAHTQYRRSA